MTTTAPTEQPKPAPNGEQTIEFPLGLLGFEQNKRFILVASPDEAPFMWLQMVDAPRHAFLVVPPAAVVPSYEPDLSDEDVRFLGLRHASEAAVMNIVTLRSNGKSTVNLKGPLVLNQRTRVGKQVIPLNVANFSLQHPLPSAD
jgi:flagellar assembly factor FliW